MENKELIPENASFRDPDGEVFWYKESIYRKINPAGLANYKLLISSGLYAKLTKLKYLVSHTEIDDIFSEKDRVFIKPQQIPFVSYPYEWSFSQLQDAALLTIEVAKIALAHDMSLKDASAYNIQFLNGKPVFIDTTSFEKYQEGEAWVAYQQFCKHFLAPLALMSKKDIRFSTLLKDFIDGIPLDLASKILPFSTKFSLSLYLHIHSHAKWQHKYSDVHQKVKPKRRISKTGMLGLLTTLAQAVKNLKCNTKNTEWSHYYDNTNYSELGSDAKAKIVERHIQQISPKTVWDLGANNGFFSRIAAKYAENVICFDCDPLAIEFNYQTLKAKSEKNILPLHQDLTNPSPSIGWSNTERTSIDKRGKADLVMGLALIHHIAISNNVPLELIAKYFASLGRHLLIEFVPKEDSQVKKLLSNRQDIFKDYNIKGFEAAFKKHFKILKSENVTDTSRTMYLMEKIDNEHRAKAQNIYNAQAEIAD